MTDKPSIFVTIFLCIAVIAGIVFAAMSIGALPTLLLGVVLLVGIGAGLAAIIVKLYVRWTEAHVKSLGAQNEFVLGMARLGYLPAGNKFQPVQQIAAPQQADPEPVDPRHALLVSLCLLTIRDQNYGPQSERLMTADDAQQQRGQFADRNNWQAASDYGQSIGLCYTKRGGPPNSQGLRINGNGAGGRTVADLLETLMARNAILDAAVNALPGVAR